MKKLVCLFLAICLFASLFVGCGGTKNDPEAVSSVASNVADSSTQEPAKKEAISLHAIHWKQLGQNVIDKFQKENDNITIQFENFPIDKYSQVIKTRMAANELPDLLGAVETDFPVLLKENVFEELTNEAFLNNYDSSLISDLKTWTNAGGKVYTIPTDSYIEGVFINKDMFTKNGIKIPENYDEYLAAAEAFKVKGIAPFVCGGKDAWPLVQSVYPLYYFDVKNPDFFGKLKTGETKWTDKPIVDAITEYQTTFGNNLLKGSMGLTYPQSFEAFSQQKAPMWTMGSWGVEFLKNSDGTPKKLDFDLGFIPAYYNHSGEAQITGGFKLGAQWGVWSQSKNVAAAKSFLEFITKPENAGEFIKGGGTTFPVRGVKAGDFIPGANLTFDVLINTPVKASPIISVSPGLEGLYNKAIQNVCMGRDVATEMIELQKAQDTANKESK